MRRPTQRARGQTIITISLPEDLLARVDALATRDARKRSPYIVRLLEEYAADLVVRLPEDLLARIDRLAAADHRTRESWIVNALESAMANEPAARYEERAGGQTNMSLSEEPPAAKPKRVAGREKAPAPKQISYQPTPTGRVTRKAPEKPD